MTNSIFRSFLATLLFLFLLANVFAAAASKQHSEYFAYIGTYTEEGSDSKGIYAYRFNSDTQQLTPIGLAAKTINPSFLAVASEPAISLRRQ